MAQDDMVIHFRIKPHLSLWDAIKLRIAGPRYAEVASRITSLIKESGKLGVVLWAPKNREK